MAQVIHIDTENSSYIMDVLPTGQLRHLYFGRRLRRQSYYAALAQKDDVPGYGTLVAHSNDHPNIGLDDQCLEHSGLGKGDYREPMIDLVFQDGSMTTDFRYVCHESTAGRPAIPGLPSALGGPEDVTTTTVTLRDEIRGINLELVYCAYNACNVITRFAVLRNDGLEPVRIRRLMSAQLDLFGGDWRFVTFDGCWANERNFNERPVLPGVYVNDSKTGHSSARHNPFVMLARDGCGEESGECYASNLVYSGNHAEICERTFTGKVRLLTGINPSGFEWLLESGQEFHTPEAVLSWSGAGYNGISLNMHRFVRAHIVRGQWADRERPVLVNNWEATEFDFDKRKLLALAKEAAGLGIELFVLDDGWFGERNDDRRGLGDWTVNRKKLPGGLSALAEKITALGMQFGIWVEPEMVNEDSRLFREHPDWAVCSPGREPSRSRNQLVLDLCKPEVRQHLVEAMTRVFKSADISYVKWDMNRNMSDMYSSSLPADRQGEFCHRYVLGLYELLEELTIRFPEILFESCASGGNRFDLGMLCYMPQVWTSDNTDAYTRLSIQNGSSYGYPQSVMGAHVSASPNMQSLRASGVETRFNVAAFGLLGYELDLTMLSTFDRKVIKEQVAFYKAHRRLLQFGRFSRIRPPLDIRPSMATGHSPDAPRTLWQVCSEDGRQAIAGLFQGPAMVGKPQDIVRTTGLDETVDYRVSGRRQYLNVRAFGNLVNRVLPVKIRGDGIVHSVLADHYMFAMTDEEYRAGGDLLNARGIVLKQQFCGPGYNQEVRLLSDYGSRLYVIEARL
jgi:alpha-galactosidase